ncbi:MAG TPA: aspartate ammonia-lyase [Acidimicrobiales bacterium]|nr:aspartate ammonia-lyase [Acidimicrobiales bacterium]
MDTHEDELEAIARRSGIPATDLRPFAAAARVVRWPAGAWLFRERAPREWFGIVLEGDVDITQGLHGADHVLAVLGPGSIIAEGVLLDESAHVSGARTRTGAAVWLIDRAAIATVRVEEPAAFQRLVVYAAERIADRLHAANLHLANDDGSTPRTTGTRREHDLLGERDVPDDVYYGIQTLRALENFPISGVPLRSFGHFIRSFALVKKAAAITNSELAELDPARRDAILAACDDIIAGRLDEHFVVDMIQGGAGTSTNMNINEVIANRGLEILGHRRGEYAHLHPNDDVNRSQSTNDAYPTAVKLAVHMAMRDASAAIDELRLALEEKAAEFADVIKVGRTEMQDAVPMTLGQEFGAYAVMVGEASRHLERAGTDLLEIALGATAIGTGINSPPGYADRVTAVLAEISGLSVWKSANLVEATQDSGDFVQMSSAMKRAAVQISKMCNDLRLLSSGPRAGFNEIQLPAMQPGSSIMPGKINPVIPEVVSEVCFQIIGYDVTITMAAEASQLELNMAEPIIAYDLLHGLTILRNATVVLTTRCIRGITANREVTRGYVERSIGLVTALNPIIGYERSVAIAKEALATGASVYDLVLAKGLLGREQLDDILRPENMTHPRELP